jgi:hypothetical protein
VLHTGKPHAEWDRQFRCIAAQREEFRRTGNPRISVDAKKKELLGNFKHAGQSWRQEAEKVNAHALGLRKIERCRRKANAQADN